MARRVSAVVVLGLLLIPLLRSDSSAGGQSTCRGKRATIVGTHSADTLEGTDGPDVIVGLGGLDQIYGRGGRDLICGGGGRENHDRLWAQILEGGRGNDVIVGSGASDEIDGGPGNDALFGRGFRDAVVGGPGNDKLVGGDDEDYLDGKGGADRVRGGRGGDTVLGGADDDVLVGGLGRDEVGGHVAADGLGRSSFYSTQEVREGGNDQLRGGRDRDLMAVGHGRDEVDGGRGIDTFAFGQPSPSRPILVDLRRGLARGGGAGRDQIAGIERVNVEAYADITLIGDGSPDVLLARTMDDYPQGSLEVRVAGRGGNDLVASLAPATAHLRGGRGRDVLREEGCFSDDAPSPVVMRGGYGADRFYSECSDQVIYAGPGRDRVVVEWDFGQEVHGGVGFDILDLKTESSVLADLSNNRVEVSGSLMTVSGIEGLLSGSGDDSLAGDDANNLLNGRGGEDQLDGNRGWDRCFNGEVVTNCERRQRRS